MLICLNATKLVWLQPQQRGTSELEPQQHFFVNVDIFFAGGRVRQAGFTVTSPIIVKRQNPIELALFGEKKMCKVM